MVYTEQAIRDGISKFWNILLCLLVTLCLGNRLEVLGKCARVRPDAGPHAHQAEKGGMTGVKPVDDF